MAIDDLTLIYYTANTIKQCVMDRLQETLLQTTGNNIPIVSVSQKPLDFGDNICVGEIGRSNYNAYKQIWVGVQEVKTKYVATVDDDTFYNMEHFNYRPSPKTFAYNSNMWFNERNNYWRRSTHLKDTGMCCCIAETEELYRVMEARYTMFPEPPDVLSFYWVEPGRFDGWFGCGRSKVENFYTKTPIVVFGYRGSMGGKRKRHGVTRGDSNFSTYLEPYGDSKELWDRYWND